MGGVSKWQNNGDNKINIYVKVSHDSLTRTEYQKSPRPIPTNPAQYTAKQKWPTGGSTS